MTILWHKTVYRLTPAGKEELRRRTGAPDSAIEGTHKNKLLRALLIGDKSARELAQVISTRSDDPEAIVRCMIGFLQREKLIRTVPIQPVIDGVAR